MELEKCLKWFVVLIWIVRASRNGGFSVGGGDRFISQVHRTRSSLWYRFTWQAAKHSKAASSKGWKEFWIVWLVPVGRRSTKIYNHRLGMVDINRQKVSWRATPPSRNHSEYDELRVVLYIPQDSDPDQDQMHIVKLLFTFSTKSSNKSEQRNKKQDLYVKIEIMRA